MWMFERFHGQESSWVLTRCWDKGLMDFLASFSFSSVICPHFCIHFILFSLSVGFPCFSTVSSIVSTSFTLQSTQWGHMLFLLYIQKCHRRESNWPSLGEVSHPPSSNQCEQGNRYSLCRLASKAHRVGEVQEQSGASLEGWEDTAKGGH